MEKEYTIYGDFDMESLLVKEPTLAYLKSKKQGEYTIEDYYALPDDRRAELIDGVLYDMASPTGIHQFFCGEIYAQLRHYIWKKGEKCLPFPVRSAVQLDRDDRTMVEPDMLVACNREQIHKMAIYGAPDFVVEVLSPETKNKDVCLKLHKYRNAGVREYWIVDPDEKTVTVYDFEHDSQPETYGFEGKVPVNIFGRECEVDFADIYEQIRFLYDE